MFSAIAGIILGFAIGATCRYFGLPAPCPSKVVGALLVFAMTLGYWCMGLL